MTTLIAWVISAALSAGVGGYALAKFTATDINQSEENLSELRPIAKSIKIEASTSAMYAECLSQSSTPQAGHNIRDCDDLRDLYIKNKAREFCKSDKNCLDYFSKK